MEIRGSSFQQNIPPLHFSNEAKRKRGNLTLIQKVKAIALAIISAIVTWMASGISMVKAFFTLKGGGEQKEEIKREEIPQVKEIKTEEKPGRKGCSIPFNDFFDTVFNPVIQAIYAKASQPKLCFIKRDTAPFSTWFKREYPPKQESIQKSNLLYLKQTCPEIENGIFVSIRGDGDCTIRSVGAGLILQTILQEPNLSVEKLLEQMKRIVIKLEAEASKFPDRVENLQVSIEERRRRAKEAENLINKHPEQYRMENGYLNDKGQKTKATLDEEREVALILEHQITELQKKENQKNIQTQIINLKSALEAFSRLLREGVENAVTPTEIRKKMIELMEREDFDQQLIVFLRKASALNIVLNMEKMELYVKQLSNQEQVILGEISIFDLIMQRGNARQPNQEYLQGSINDVLSLSMLFKQPISWYRCEVSYEPEERIVYHFAKEELNQRKKHFYILNRPGHSDLILV